MKASQRSSNNVSRTLPGPKVVRLGEEQLQHDTESPASGPSLPAEAGNPRPTPLDRRSGSSHEELSEVLSEFARTMVTDFPIQGILDHLVMRIVEIMPVTAAGVTLIAPGREPEYVAASNAAALRFEQLQTDWDEGPCLLAYRTGEAVSVPDLGSEDRFPTFAARALESGLAAVFTFPLNHGEMRLGALDMYRDTAGALSDEWMKAAQTLADVAAAYLINAQARADLQESSEQSREAALHDALTGLPNRVLLLQRIEHAINRAERSHKHLALFFLDLDRFKQVNDTYGHQVGDQLLVAIADRLTEVLRPGDSLARLSGDEFAALCEDLDDPVQADTIASRFEAALAAPFFLSGDAVDVNASIGIAFAGPGRYTPEELIHRADLGMYRAKSHRDGVSDGVPVPRTWPGDGLARGLSGAVDRGELHVAYQPIVDTLDGRLIAVEALMRWTRPGHGLISPTVFIPLAEQSGQILDLGQWILEHAWADHHQRRHDVAGEIGMSVNVSAHQFLSNGFSGAVAALLEGASALSELLTLEITESVFLRDKKRAFVVLDELKDMGVKLALDDFGTGYSSLGYLNALPVDTLKIDQTFISELSANPASQAIAAAIIQLAHGLGMTVVAEGVETAEQHQILTALGSDACQGFYFARPMPHAMLDSLMRDRDTPPQSFASTIGQGRIGSP